jgi:hypothetical protein
LLHPNNIERQQDLCPANFLLPSEGAGNRKCFKINDLSESFEMAGLLLNTITTFRGISGRII